MSRGEIRDHEQASQIMGFWNLRYGNITPTNIDAFLEFENKLIVIVEAKYRGLELPFGQMLAFARLCDACQSGGVESFVIHAGHDSQTPRNKDGHIDLASCWVADYYHRYEWHTAEDIVTVAEFIDRVREACL